MYRVQWPSFSVHAEPDHSLMETPGPAVVGEPQTTHISDLPSVILTNIFTCISNPRVRNCMALTCRDWYILERQTRTVLSLRGNICGMQELPMCYQQVSVFDLSQCSPWGHSLFQSTRDGEEIGNRLKSAFPNVTDLTVYVRDALDIQMVAWLWPDIEDVRLVRWHQRAMENMEAMDLGHEIKGLLSTCKKLKTLNLSKFYCWTEDVPPALQSEATTAANLRVLNLLKLSPEGFKAQEVGTITASCPNLEEFYVLCEFDHRLLDSVGDEALLAIANNCLQLRVLHLVDFHEYGVLSGNAAEDGYASEDATLSRQGLEAMFKALPHLEDLAFLLSQNMRDVGPSFEVCASHCKKLRSLKLSHFHGICRGPQLDGVSLCSGLQELSLRNCADLTDEALGAVSIGCPKLSKLGLRGCKYITEEGLRSCVASLSRPLKDVEVAFCQLLPTATTLQALEPIQTSVKNLHLDCVWDEGILAQEAARLAAPHTHSTGIESRGNQGPSGIGPPLEIGRLRGGTTSWSEPNFGFCGTDEVLGRKREMRDLTPHRLDTKRRRSAVPRENGRDFGGVADSTSLTQNGSPSVVGSSHTGLEAGSTYPGQSDGLMNLGLGSHQPGLRTQNTPVKVWKSLEALSLWIPVGELISPLPAMGLVSCPALQELRVRVEGDSRRLRKPRVLAWGIQSLARYPKLEKVELDLSEVTGFSLSAPVGFMDLSLWDRHYLTGINALNLTELDYWPPSDKEVNRRGLSLPAVGLLSQCSKLRKLFVHGTTHEHFLMMLVRCEAVRDVQLRGDYYPAPEQETDTELRAISCQRFEAAVAKRGFPD